MELGLNIIPSDFTQWTEQDLEKEVYRICKGKYSIQMSEDFLNYWAQYNPKGLMKFQEMKSWDTKRRLSTWFKKSKKDYEKQDTPEIKELREGII